MTLGDVLKQYREENKISMDDFAKKSSLSKGYISMLENNINPRNNKPIAPTLPTIKKIAGGMNIDVDTLLKLLDENQNISLEDNVSDKSGDSHTIAFGIRLKERREQLGLKQSDVAKMLGITAGAICNYENGVSLPKSNILFRIFDVLRCDANYLFQDEMSDELYDFKTTYQEQEYLKKYRAISKYDHDAKMLIDSTLDYLFNKLNIELKIKTQLDEQSLYISELGKAISDSQKKVAYRHVDFYQTCPSFTGEVMWKDVLKAEIEIPDNEKTKDVDFVITVDDDSMEPLYWNADMVLVQKADKIKLGEIGVFTLDGVCLIKEYGKDRLISRNPDYPPTLVNSGADLKCMGKVIGSLTEHSDEELDYMTQRRKHIRNYNRVYNMVAENGLEDDEETHEIVDKMLTAMKEKHGTNE